MNGAECKDSDAESLVREVEELCGSDALSLDALRGKLDRIPRNAAKGSTILHRACMNAKISLEVVECILDAFPNAARERTTKFSEDDAPGEKAAYPLHLACYNKTCPPSVIELLMKLNPEALQHFSVVEYGLDRRSTEGLPLQYFLRKASSISIDIVEIMVNAYPEALEVNTNTEIGPVHAVLSNDSLSGDELLDVLDYFSQVAPQSLCVATSWQETPLHFACKKSNANPSAVQLLADGWPESIAQQDHSGMIALHDICWNDELDDETSMEILSIFMNKAPSFPSIMQLESEDDGFLPIHLAAEYKSSQFCKILTEACPESAKILSSEAGLPIHAACRSRREDSLEIFKLLFEAYPEGIRVDFRGNQPLYEALRWGDLNSGVVRFLLAQDADAASKPSTDRQLPLHTACHRYCGASLNIVRMVFDEYPKAIRLRDNEGRTPLQRVQIRGKENEEVIEFLKAQLNYARKARSLRALTTLDCDGRLPLHQALYDNASLGAVKLLASANPAALRVFDNRKMIPLHIACEFSSLDVVHFLVELDESCMHYCDSKKNTTLHHACRGGNCSIIKYIREKDAPSVSQHNGDGKLPIQLLLERQKDDVDCGGIEYIESIWSLLLAHPETVMEL